MSRNWIGTRKDREGWAPTYTNLHTPDEELWSEILPGLWQGGTADFDVVDSFVRRGQKPQITKANFDTVITAYAVARPVDWLVREFRFGYFDSDRAGVEFPELFDIVRLAHSDWKRGNRVLIRCQAGWNRSGLITALVLIRDGMAAEEAIALIRRRRSQFALCNRNFEAFLLSVDPADWQGNEYGEGRGV